MSQQPGRTSGPLLALLLLFVSNVIPSRTRLIGAHLHPFVRFLLSEYQWDHSNSQFFLRRLVVQNRVLFYHAFPPEPYHISHPCGDGGPRVQATVRLCQGALEFSANPCRGWLPTNCCSLFLRGMPCYDRAECVRGYWSIYSAVRTLWLSHRSLSPMFTSYFPLCPHP